MHRSAGKSALSRFAMLGLLAMFSPGWLAVCEAKSPATGSAAGAACIVELERGLLAPDLRPDAHSGEDLPPPGLPAALLGKMRDFKDDAGNWRFLEVPRRTLYEWELKIVGKPFPESWPWEAPPAWRPDRVYRGMSLSPSAMRNILKNGIVPMATPRGDRAISFDVVFAASTPAFEYMFAGMYNQPELAQYPVLFEIDSRDGKVWQDKHNNLMRPMTGDDQPAAEVLFDSVAPSRITRVLIADPQSATPEFPFRSYTIEQARTLFGVK